jgi:amino acid permease
MNEPGRRLRVRAFVAIVLAFSGVGLPLTGLVNHFRESLPVSAEDHAWQGSHAVLGILFVAFSVWHIVLNRRPLWNHIRSRTSRFPSVSRELALAGIVVASILFLIVGQEFVAHGG